MRDQPPEGARPSREPVGVLVCFLCKMSSSDDDPSQEPPAGKLPFNIARSAPNLADPFCDHCESFLRYFLKSRSRVEVQRRLDDPTTSSEFLGQLALYMALRGDMQRVSSQRLELQMSLVAKRDTILAKLRMLQGLPVVASTARDFHIMGLRDYIVQKGNPLLNGHNIVAMRHEQALCLAVEVPGVMAERGCFGCEQVADDVSPSFRTNGILRLCALGVDNLPTLRVVQDTVKEYANRQALVKCLQARREPCGSSVSSRPGDALVMRSSGAASSRDGGIDGRAPSSGQGSGLPRLAEQPGSPRASCRSLRAHPPPPSATPASKAGPAQPRTSPTSAVERTMEKLRIKVRDIANYFAQSWWATKIRGKEKVFKNLNVAIADAVAVCCKEEREDFLPELDGLQMFSDNGKSLVCYARGKIVDNLDATVVAPFIEVIHNYLMEQKEAGLLLVGHVAPNLQKMEAKLCWAG